jgi:hypothetical protein
LQVLRSFKCCFLIMTISAEWFSTVLAPLAHLRPGNTLMNY